jgi:hypothetical protein|tara:strand:- start:373 stop:576 length:204 start_codon:yes stop_codon:yes gene_type:complete
MESIFKFGDHFFAGISLLYIKPINAYSLLVTFMLLHLTIDMLHYGFRIGISIGNGEFFFKIQTGTRI